MPITADPVIPIPAFITGRDELAAGEQHTRAGTMDNDAPDGTTLVVARGRFVYKDDARGIDTLILRGQQFYMADHRVAANVARELIFEARTTPVDWWCAPGRVLHVEPCDAAPLTAEPTPGALRIVAGVGYDPGSAAFRLHSAINEATKHASAFVRWADTNPHCSLRQYDGEHDAATVRRLIQEADVIHNHIAPFLINNTGIRPRPEQLVIRHYHGSSQKGTHLEPTFDRAQGYLLLGARLSLVAEAKAEGLEMAWSPIPMPVQRYRALRDAARADASWVPLDGAATDARPLRIAHSPTNERIKGSAVLRDVVERLRARGVPVVVDFIRNVSLAESLRRKALCDVCFDSFWLGIQGSGLEAGAMEMPVIAGDEAVREMYQDELGYCPYTFANDPAQLEREIESLSMDEGYREQWAQKTALYVEEIHDYPAVALRYEQTLSVALGRSDVLTWGS